MESLVIIAEIRASQFIEDEYTNNAQLYSSENVWTICDVGRSRNRIKHNYVKIICSKIRCAYISKLSKNLKNLLLKVADICDEDFCFIYL